MSGAVQVEGAMAHWRAINETKQEMAHFGARLAGVEIKLDALIRVGWLIFSACVVLGVGAVARTILIGG